MNCQPLQPAMNNYSPAMNCQPVQPAMNNYPSTMNCQLMQPAMNWQPAQPAMNNYPPAINCQPVQPAMNNFAPAMNCQPVQPAMNYQPVQPAMNNYPSTMNWQPMQPALNCPPVQSMTNNPVDNNQQSSFNGSCVVSVSYNFSLKFIISSNQLKSLRNDSVIQSGPFHYHSAGPFYLEMDRDYHITFKHSDNWESFELVYAFVESKDRAFSLKESPQLSFLTPFLSPCVDDEAVAVHCLVTAFPRCSSAQKDQNMDPVKLPVSPGAMSTVPLSPQALPNNYKNKKVIDFMRKGVIPSLDVDMAVEIIGEANAHKCKVLTILCVEYLMKNTTVYYLKKILKAATDNRLQRLQEKCVIEIEKCEITKKEHKTNKCEKMKEENEAEKCGKKKNETEKCEKTKKENKAEKCEKTKKENVTKKNEKD